MDLELLKQLLPDALCPEQEMQKCVGLLLRSAASYSAASSHKLIIWIISSWLLGAGHSSKKVAGDGDNSDGLNHTRAKPSPAQDPEPLVVLSMGSQLCDVGRSMRQSQSPSFRDKTLKSQQDRFCY